MKSNADVSISETKLCTSTMNLPFGAKAADIASAIEAISEMCANEFEEKM